MTSERCLGGGGRRRLDRASQSRARRAEDARAACPCPEFCVRGCLWHFVSSPWLEHLPGRLGSKPVCMSQYVRTLHLCTSVSARPSAQTPLRLRVRPRKASASGSKPGSTLCDHRCATPRRRRLGHRCSPILYAARPLSS